MKISDCECNVAATSHGTAPKAALVIQNHEFAENTCMPLFMISVRSSLDSGAPNVRLTQNVSDGFRVCLTRSAEQNRARGLCLRPRSIGGVSLCIHGRH